MYTTYKILVIVVITSLKYKYFGIFEDITATNVIPLIVIDQYYIVGNQIYLIR
jgi:hypothetical protein